MSLFHKPQYFTNIINNEDEIKKLENLINLKLNKVELIYDYMDLSTIESYKDNTLKISEIFYKKCQGLQNIIILFKTENDKIFGFNLNCFIEKYTVQKFKDSFIFSLTDNKIYKIKSDCFELAECFRTSTFTFYNNNGVSINYKNINIYDIDDIEEFKRIFSLESTDEYTNLKIKEFNIYSMILDENDEISRLKKENEQLKRQNERLKNSLNELFK